MRHLAIIGKPAGAGNTMSRPVEWLRGPQLKAHVCITALPLTIPRLRTQVATRRFAVRRTGPSDDLFEKGGGTRTSYMWPSRSRHTPKKLVYICMGTHRNRLQSKPLPVPRRPTEVLRTQRERRPPNQRHQRRSRTGKRSQKSHTTTEG